MGRLLAAVLASLLLAGCGWMDGSYVSVEPHQVAVSQSDGGNVRTVSSYIELRNALIGMVDDGAAEGLFSLAEYPGEEVLEDMERSVDYVLYSYPLGAYAVEAVDYDIGTGLGASALSVDISYRKTREEIAAIRTVRRIEGAQDAVADAMDEFASRLVLQITLWQDTDFVAMVREYAAENPDRVMEVPGVAVTVYPDRGDTRVVELNFYYRTDREELRSMREQVQPVFSSAALYVTGQASERTKYAQLHTFLTERFEYTMASSLTPSYSLLCEGVGDSKAFAQVYAAMCRRIGLQATVVSGELNGADHWWNRICIDGNWYHVDLLESRQFGPKTDEQMTGYLWEE